MDEKGEKIKAFLGFYLNKVMLLFNQKNVSSKS